LRRVVFFFVAFFFVAFFFVAFFFVAFFFVACFFAFFFAFFFAPIERCYCTLLGSERRRAVSTRCDLCARVARARTDKRWTPTLGRCAVRARFSMMRAGRRERSAMTIRFATATLLVAAMFFAACMEPTTVVISEPVEEDRAHEFRTMLAAREIPASLRQVDELHWVVVVDTKDGTNEYVAKYELDARIAARKIPERPLRYGTPLPDTAERRERARPIEEELRAFGRGISSVSVRLMEFEPPSATNGASPGNRNRAHVCLVYEAVDERGTAAFRVDQLEKLVAERTGLEVKDVFIFAQRHVPIASGLERDQGEQPNKLD
jgi:hypothetical protein